MLSDHARVRALAAIVALCGLVACSSEAPSSDSAPSSSQPPSVEPAQPPSGPAPEVQAAIAAIPAGPEDLPPPAGLPELDTESEAEAQPDDATTGELVGAESASAEGVEGDPLAPILPEGAEPGSAEADAELLALLDESTLTQEEFAQGFGKGGPKLDGEQFVFGPNSRTRGTPLVRVGAVEGAGAKALRARAEAERRSFESCLAMGLSKDESVTGSLSLRLSFDSKGAVSSVAVEQPSLGGAAEVRESLTGCLRSIPAKWELPEAAGASSSLPLTLSIEEAS